MDLLAYLRILRRRWTLILAVVIAGAAIGAGSALLSSESSDGQYFKATHLLILDPTISSEGETASAFTNLDQIAILVATGEVPNRVGEKVGQDGRELAEHVIVTTNSISSTLEITAAATSASESEEIADTFAEELIASINEKDQLRFEQRRDRTVQRLDEIQAEIAALDAQVGAGGGELVVAQRDGLVNQYRLTYEQFQQLAQQGTPVSSLSTLESATPRPIDTSEYNERLRRGALGENITRVGQTEESDTEVVTTSSSFSSPVSRGVLGGFLGLLFGAGIAIAAEHLDRRLRSRHEVEDAYGQPVLAEVPRLSKRQSDTEEVVSHTAPLSRTAEAHRAVRSALLFQHVTQAQAGSNGDRERATAPATAAFVAEEPKAAAPLVVLVTSAQPNEGKTTTTANLAAVFAESGVSVLAVNCDFRRPSLHRYLGAPNEPRRVHDSTIPGVAVVSGVVTDSAANPAQIIAAQRQVVTTARERFDVILLDTAPLLTTNDAIEIVSVVDFVIIVARPDVTTADGAERTRLMLERVNAPIAGVVYIGDVTVSDNEYYYYAKSSGVMDPARAAPTEVNEDASTTPDHGLTWSTISGGPRPGAHAADEESTEEIALVSTDNPRVDAARSPKRPRPWKLPRKSRSN
jgi:Mrp family chromosome partitioning ATPase